MPLCYPGILSRIYSSGGIIQLKYTEKRLGTHPFQKGPFKAQRTWPKVKQIPTDKRFSCGIWRAMAEPQIVVCRARWLDTRQVVA
jgi:hypothetical protein